jgi:hypothetical protein
MGQNMHQTVSGLGKPPVHLFEKHFPQRTLQEQKRMSCDVIFGSPSADCRGTGVCKISAKQTPTSIMPNRDCKATTGIFTSQNDGRVVSVVFFRELLCVNVLRRHLMSNVLELREPCPLPSSLITFLGLRIKRLEPGKYPIEEGAGFYRVTFNT